MVYTQSQLLLEPFLDYFVQAYAHRIGSKTVCKICIKTGIQLIAIVVVTPEALVFKHGRRMKVAQTCSPSFYSIHNDLFFFFLIESKIDAKIGKVYLFALFVLRNESNVIASCSSLFFFFFFFFLCSSISAQGS